MTAPRTDPPTPDPLPPGPYSVEWPDEQGGLFTVWGRQGTPPDFADGWAIPLVAKGMQSVMEWLADHLNRGASWSTSTPIASATESAAGGAPSPEAKTTTDAALPSAPDQRLREALRVARDRLVAEVREGTRTLSDAYRNDADEAKRWATAVDRIHLAVAQFAIDEDAALSEATTSPEATLDVAWREAGDDLSDEQRLLLLAAWFDMWDRPETDRQAILDDPRNPGRNDVQRDLRRIAARLRGPA